MMHSHRWTYLPVGPEEKKNLQEEEVVNTEFPRLIIFFCRFHVDSYILFIHFFFMNISIFQRLSSSLFSRTSFTALGQEISC